MVKYLIEANVPINQVDAWGNTPALKAAEYNCLDCLKILVEQRADIFSPNRDGTTPLMIAVQKGNSNIVNYFNSLHPFNLETKLNIALCAVRKGHKDILESLDLKPADFSRMIHGTTLLNVALVEGSSEIVQSLMSKKANLNSQDEMGMTPLAMAAKKGSVEYVQKLIELKANMEVRSGEHHWTAVHVAAANGQVNVLNALIAARAENSLDKHGNSALEIAILHGKMNIIERLAGNNLNGFLSNGETIATMAAKYGRSDVIEYLAEKRANVSLPNASGHTPTWIAVTENQNGILNTLNRYGFNVQSETNWHFSVNTAAGRNNTRALKLLFDMKADVSVNHNTALKIAVQKGNLSAVSTLLELKANPFDRDPKTGRMPFEHANQEVNAFILAEQLGRFIYNNFSAFGKGSVPDKQLSRIYAEFGKEERARNWEAVLGDLNAIAQHGKMLLSSPAMFPPISNAERQYLQEWQTRDGLAQKLINESHKQAAERQYRRGSR